VNTDIQTAITVVKRDGSVVSFNASKINEAIRRAYIDVHGHAGDAMNAFVAEATSRTADQVLKSMARSGRGSVQIEEIQDAVELTLMRMEDGALAKGYILFRAQQAEKRATKAEAVADSGEKSIKVISAQGEVTVTVSMLQERVKRDAEGLIVDWKRVAEVAMRDLFEGCKSQDVERALAATAKTMIENDPAYDFLAARLVLSNLFEEVAGIGPMEVVDREEAYRESFIKNLKVGVEGKRLDPEMMKFDLKRLASALHPERDHQFKMLGIDTLAQRYFVKVGGKRLEMPQGFFMRVAMGLSLREIDRDARAVEFYEVLSRFDFMSSTPTLFNSGTVRSQLASCYLTTVADDLDCIFESFKENALLQKYAGGLGNDWTRVRALGSYIRGTDGKSQGVIPYLKIVNDTAVAVNQGGKRPGAVCSYLETWHLDIEEFLQLRKNTGDDLRRTHQMNTANWIPDLFMKRVAQDGEWTLFSPDQVPDLHDLWGQDFEKAYNGYEDKAKRGELPLHKTVKAASLWRSMLSMLFETGHPWLTWKDACNARSPQQHVGVIHSSNLCTEITLNTSDSETAVCNIGSVNLAQHLTEQGEIDHTKLRKTVHTAMRMLDNVIDINHYSVKKARDSNLRHRPVGVGMMGYQSALYQLRLPFDSDGAMQFADTMTEALCYYAYEASACLAEERGRYSTYRGSLWDKGIMPLDSIDILEASRGMRIDVDRSSTMDWDALRALIQKHGMRNSNCVAVAPTATIANIIGVEPAIEPAFSNLSVKSNLGGEFTVLNHSLVRDLQALGMWDKAMVADLKAFDGSLERIERVPQEMKALYRTAFEVDPLKVIEGGARRQKWIDQAQSLNLWIRGASGKKLMETYMRAWQVGLKTTYYLRTLSATSAEKSTITTSSLNAVQTTSNDMPEPTGAVCMLRPGDPGFESCESCQ
jgi:ribonucleoside-diphosphate reductase alpha chain